MPADPAASVADADGEPVGGGLASSAEAHGSHGDRLASGTLLQQGAQFVVIAAGLVVVTALGRTLDLAEFGVWGLTLSLVGYFTFVQGSVETAAVRELSHARDQRAIDRAFTTALAVYAAVGALMGVALVLGGIALLGIFDISDELEDQARTGIIALGLVMAIGWPTRAFRDILQAGQRFALSAAADAVSYAIYAVALLVLVIVVEPPLWVLILASGLVPMTVGLVCGVMLLRSELSARLRPRLLDRAYARTFLGFTGSLLMISITDVVIFQLDRTVLAAFRSASTVGLYEAVVRPSAFVRQLQGALSFTVFPASTDFLAEGDDVRVGKLLVRGTRYVTAAVAPVSVIFIVLSAPILEVWLGPEFREAAPAMSILVASWIFGSATALLGSVLIAAGKTRVMIAYAWSLALINLGLSLALTPALGLEGVVIGTATAFAVVCPILIVVACRHLPVSVGDFARGAWLPAYSLAVPLAGVLVVLRLGTDLDSAVPLLGVIGLSLVGYAAAYWRLWLEPDERALARRMIKRRG